MQVAATIAAKFNRHLPKEITMLLGSCMCKKVKYEIEGEPRMMYHCHCGKCRAASGASFVTNIIVATNQFWVIAGREHLYAYESSPNKHRYFCSNCGSPVYSDGQATQHYVAVRCGTLESDPGVRPAHHSYVTSKAAWVTIEDELPQYTERPTPATQ